MLARSTFWPSTSGVSFVLRPSTTARASDPAGRPPLRRSSVCAMVSGVASSASTDVAPGFRPWTAPRRVSGVRPAPTSVCKSKADSPSPAPSAPRRQSRVETSESTCTVLNVLSTTLSFCVSAFDPELEPHPVNSNAAPTTPDTKIPRTFPSGCFILYILIVLLFGRLSYKSCDTQKYYITFTS